MSFNVTVSFCDVMRKREAECYNTIQKYASFETFYERPALSSRNAKKVAGVCVMHEGVCV